MTRAGWDELEEEGGWVVARQGDSFTALYSHQPAVWWGESELVALGRQVARSVLFCTYCSVLQNVWLVHVGGPGLEYPDFAAFRAAVLNSSVEVGS